MKIHSSIEAATGLEGTAICLGNFDGVHLGHQALFNTAARFATPVALTFDPHPGKVLQPELAPKLITPLPRKLELMRQHGLAAVVVQPFSLAYARTSPAAFEEALFAQLKVAHVIVGYDFTYGALRKGTLETLREAAQKHHAQVHVVAPVTVEGVVASSSRIREYILEGRVGAAQKLLGRFFDLEGTVIHGDGRGRTIGFPTANVDTPQELRPAPGVYAVKMQVEGSAQWHPGAANIGVRPTFGGQNVSIEVHLIDFEQDLYGKNVRVQFNAHLRAEMRFSSIEALRSQIARDIERARQVLKNEVPPSGQEM